MSKPVVGKPVLFHPKLEEGAISSEQPHMAFICYVNEGGTVNVAGFDNNGNVFTARSIAVLKAGGKPEDGSAYAEWPKAPAARKKVTK